MRDWLDGLQDGHLEAWLHHLTFSRAGEESQGYGRLVWTVDGSIEVEAFSHIQDPSSAFMDSFQWGIIPRSEHYTLNALTEDGWAVEIPNIVVKPSARMTAGISRWRFSSNAMTMTMPFEADGRVLRALLGPFVRIDFPRYSESKNDNPFFGGDRVSRDWLKLETTFGAVACRRSGEDQAVVVIEAELDRPGLLKALYSVQTAMSFVEGRNIRIIGSETICDGQHTRGIARTNWTTRGRFVPPFGWMHSISPGIEDFLSLATNFFYSGVGVDISDRLRMCWAVADSYASQRAMAACGAVDKLIKQEGSNFEGLVVEPEEKARKLIKRFLGKQRGKLSDRFLNRIGTFLDKMGSLDTKDILRRWIEDGHLGIVQADLKAWDDLRHPVMHGELKFNFGDEDEQAFRKMYVVLRRVENMVNKIILSQMSYSGIYFDHVSNQFEKLRA